MQLEDDESNYVIYFIQETIYDLFGVINHIGSMQFGHYTAYIKNQ